MTKTPYEIRLELLKLAQEQANYRFSNEWEKAIHNAEQTESKTLTEVPEFPTTETILVEAAKMKAFIDTV